MCIRDSKTVILTGDGGLNLNLGEVWTAVQEALDLTVIVMNDRGYGVIRHIQDAQNAPRRYDRLAAPDLQGLAALADMPYRRVAAPAELGDAATEMIAHSGPALIEVDMIAIGEAPPYYPYGPKLG